MRKMLMILIVLFLSVALFATTNHTITIDGTNDFTVANEQFTTSTTDWYDYFTWDNSNIYYGVNGADIDVDNKVMMIYIDTNPQLTETEGTGSTTGGTWGGVTHTLPFTANYWFTYKNGYYNLRKYDAGWQIDQSYNGSVSTGTDFKEISIPLSDIGNPSQIYIVMFVQNDDGSWTWSAAPPTGFTDGSGNKTFSHYYGFELTSGVLPNDAGNEDNSLPITLKDFSANFQNGHVVLNWSTASESENAKFNIYRKENSENEFTKLGDVPGAGNSSTSHSYSFVDNSVKAGVNYEYLLSDIDYGGIETKYTDLIQTVLVPENSILSMNEYRLINAYPNPFNPSINIEYSIPDNSTANFTIYDLNGRKVWEANSLQNESAGVYTLNWDGTNTSGANLPSGIYIFKMTGKKFNSSHKLFLLK